MKKIKILFALLLSLSFSLSFAQKKSKQKASDKDKKTFNTLIDSVSYSIGVSIGKNIKDQGFDTINADLLALALKDAIGKKTLLITPENAEKVLQNYFTNMQQQKSEKNLKDGAKFLEENKKKAGVVTLPSGLQYQVLKEGDGSKPKETDKVTTHYHGTLLDGTVFDSSVERKQPATFPVNGVIPGWVEALQLMKVGSKWKLFVPSNLAYGERGAGGAIGPNETLIFEVELLEIEQQ